MDRVLIEADRSCYSALVATYAGNEHVHCVNRTVDTEGRQSLDNILASLPVPNRFDLLLIDIEGNDFHVWRSPTDYQSTLVVIEFNPTIPPDMGWVQPDDPDCNQGSSLRPLATLGRGKGYELAVTDTSAFLVRDELHARFGIANNAPEALIRQTKYLTRVFQLKDGTLIWSGCDRLLWAGVPSAPERLQMLPRVLRFLPGARHPQALRLFRCEYLRLLLWRYEAESQIEPAIGDDRFR